MNFGELQTAILDDLSVTTTDTFYSTAYIKRIANRAVNWLANLRNWQQTQHAYKFNSTDDAETAEYYNYPEDFKTDSIWRLIFDGDRYERKNFKDYLKYQDDYSAATEKIYADHRRQIFINPKPTSVAEISIWGHKIPADMSADADQHPFHDEAELEEAILKYAIGLALKKGRGTNYNRGVTETREARALALEIWEVQKKEQAKYKTHENKMFNHIEILPYNGQRRTRRGSFNTCNN